MLESLCNSAYLSHAAIFYHALEQVPEVLVADVALGHDAGEGALRVVRTLKSLSVAQVGFLAPLYYILT